MARIRTTRQARAIRFGLAFGYHDAYRVFSTGEGPKNRPFRELTQKAYDVAYLRETNKLHTAEDFEALRGRAGRILRSQGYGSRKIKEEEPPVASSRRSASRSSSDVSYTPIVVDTYVDGGSSSASFSCD